MIKDRFLGKTAVVTGGAAGIGEAVAMRIASEGGKVMVWDRDGAAIGKVKEHDPAIDGIELDLTDYSAVENAAKKTSQTFGSIDILVCSAGITGPNLKTWEYSPQDWCQVFDVNVHGVFHANRACVPYMIDGNYGRIINIASVAGKEGNPNAAAYSASKSAVIGLTKSLGKELADKSIMVNCVSWHHRRTPEIDPAPIWSPLPRS